MNIYRTNLYRDILHMIESAKVLYNRVILRLLMEAASHIHIENLIHLKNNRNSVKNMIQFSSLRTLRQLCTLRAIRKDS